MTIRFPKPHVSAINYELNDLLPGFFDEFADAMAPQGDKEPELSMARYNPSRFHKAQKVKVNELALVGLIRSGLLKRFESSIHAFRETLRRMIESHEKFLAALDRGYIALMRDLDEWSLGDSDEELERILAEGESEPAEDYDVLALRKAVMSDTEALRGFRERVKSIGAKEDPKLARLEELLAEAQRRADREAYSEEDFRDKRKIIVFSYYEDTLRWIEDYLKKALKKNPDLKVYRDRMVSVSGSNGRGDVSRRKAVFGFVPVSSEAPPGTEDRFDIMLTTDVLAEGMNLQQCRNVINYDLPWNPMRLVQRHGRIDRIGSPHEDVYIRCFFPDQRLDEMLALEDRIRRKLAQAAATIGVESEVVPDGAVSRQVFSDTREQIDALRREETELFDTEGKDPAALSGEEYRQELRKALQTREKEIRGLPACAGSGLAGGRENGVFFCARVGERVFVRFVRPGATIGAVERYWEAERAALRAPGARRGAPKSSAAGSPGGASGTTESARSNPPEAPVIRETLSCLKLIHCDEHTPRDLPDAEHLRAYEAWTIARRDIWHDWQRFTDPTNLVPRVERLFRQMADHVRRFPADLSQDALKQLIETLEAPWDVRTRRAFQGFFDPDAEDPDGITRRIQETVRDRGMMPFKMPDVSPEIKEDEIQLVCWMVVRK